MKIGASKVDITPPVGVDLAGYAAREKGSSGIADNLYSKTLVLDDGKEKIAIVTNDLIGLGEKTVNRIRKIAEEKTGIRRDKIMVSCSHTHSGPATIPLKGCGKIDVDYFSTLENTVADGIYLAFQKMEEASIGVGKGKVRINVNRSGKIREEDLTILPNPEGIVDDEVGVAIMKDKNGFPIATWINYACHPVVLGPENLLISADYPGATQRFIEKKMGGMVLFSNGCCGNLNPIIYPGTFEDVENLGISIGERALRLAGTISTSSKVKFKIVSKRISLPVQKPPSLERMERMVEEKRKELEKIRKMEHDFLEFNVSRIMFEWARASLEVLKEGKFSEKIEIEVFLLAFNNAILIGIPGEVFAEIGVKIKESSVFKYTFILGYTNGLIGYIPTKGAFLKGGYEVEVAHKYYGAISPLSPEAERVLIDEVLRLMKEVKS